MEPWDWKGTLVMDKEALKEELEFLKQLLEEYPSRRYPSCIISATDEDDARLKTTQRFIKHFKIPLRFHKNLRVRRLP